MPTQVKAQIVVAQVDGTPPEGYESGAWSRLVTGKLITLTNLDDAGVESWSWTISPPVNRVVADYSPTGLDGATATLDPAGWGDVVVTLTVQGAAINGRLNRSTASVTLAIPRAVTLDEVSYDFPVPHYKEQGPGTGSNAVDTSKGAQGRLSQLGVAVANLASVVAGIVIGALPQDLGTGDSPTFAGLTLTGLSGFVRATAGVLSASAMALADLPVGGAGTVLAGTGAAPAYTDSPVLRAVKDNGANPSTTGFIRASNNVAIVKARNAANSSDWPVLSTTATNIVLGDAAGPPVSIDSATTVTMCSNIRASATGLYLLDNDTTALWGGDTTGLGDMFRLVSAVDTELSIGDGVGAVTASVGTDCQLRIADGTYAWDIFAVAGAVARAASNSTSVTFTHEDLGTNGATGGSAYFLAQSCTGTTSIGGAAHLGSGAGTSANGEVRFSTGGTTRLSLTGSGKSLYFAAALTTAVSLTQADNTTNSATGTRLEITSQICTGTTSTGGELRFTGGDGTTRAGYITFYRGATIYGQIGNGAGGGTYFGNSGNAATGASSFAAGYSNTASNNYSIALGQSNSCTAGAAFCAGYNNSIGGSADYSAAIGYANSITSSQSAALGASNTVGGGVGAIGLGYACTASNVVTLATGFASTASSYGEHSFSSCGAATGTPQTSRIVVTGTTTATATTNVNLKAGTSADQEIATRTGRIYSVRVTFVATGPSFSPVGQIELKNALVKNNGGTLAIIDAGTQVASASTPVDWTIALNATGSNNYLRVNFAKTADATALRCVALVELVDIAKA